MAASGEESGDDVGDEVNEEVAEDVGDEVAAPEIEGSEDCAERERHEGVDEAARRVGRGKDGERDEGSSDAAEAETLKPINGIGAIEELFDHACTDDDKRDEPDGEVVKVVRGRAVAVAPEPCDERGGDDAGGRADDSPGERLPERRRADADGGERQALAAADDPKQETRAGEHGGFAGDRDGDTGPRRESVEEPRNGDEGKQRKADTEPRGMVGSGGPGEFCKGSSVG